MNSRRDFLKHTIAGAVSAGVALRGSTRPKVLVNLFQRGAVDALNMIVPFGEPRYYELRPALAIAPPSTADGAIGLDGFFGLHPALAPLKPAFDEQRLAIVHATGSPDPTRSHFDAQDYMESGAPGRKAVAGGWLNRALPPGTSRVRAVAIGASLARTLRGSNDALAMTSLDDFQVRDRNAAQAFERMYGGGATFEAMRVIEDVRRSPYTPANGASYPNSRLGSAMASIARLIKADIGLEAAFAEAPGWDTHANQAATLNNLFADFAKAIAAFRTDLGERLDDVVLVTLSEFGRTARENGTRGTDHGHGGAAFVLGGAVRGGKVYGAWPGLSAGALYQERDLAVTTDFRDVLAELVVHHLGARDVAPVFPGYSPKPAGLLA